MDKKKQHVRARYLRKNATDAELRLWYFLRGRQLKGVKFRRQSVIGPYIADFVSFDPKIVVELDGGQHARQKARDSKRTRWLNSQGFRVLRFWNHDVLEESEAVVEAIWYALNEEIEKGARAADKEG
jgi:very-short-patch-repair endonuclease